MAGGNRFFLYFSRIPATIFFPSRENDVSRKSFIPAFPQKEKKAVNKRILLPLNKNSDSASRNERFVQKSFHHAEKLLSSAGMYKMRRKWFPVVGEKLLYEKWLHHNLNNGFHQHEIYSE